MILKILDIIIAILNLVNPLKLIKKIIFYAKKPQIEIYYDANETYHKARDLSFNRILGNFAHLMVKNNGKLTAKNCIGELRSIQELRENEFQNVTTYRHIMALKWAHEIDFSPKDIETNTPRRLDLCYVHQGHDILHFFTEKYPSGNQTDFPAGEYKVKIRVKSDNAKSVGKEFIVKYVSGDFDSLEIRNV